MKLFEELTQLHGVSGYETAVADYIKEKLAPLADDITTDPNGSVIAYFKGTGEHKKRIELAAHTDEIGFQVIKIEEDGRIMFKELGCCWTFTTYQSRVRFRNGVVGVVASRIPPEKLPLALNQHLPPDIRVLAAQTVPEDFHARYAAHTKTYLYRIHNNPIDSPFDAAYYTRVPRRLDEAAMQAAAQQFVGTHDFLALCAAGSSAAAHGDTVRTITDCHVTRRGDEVDIEVTADGYLYNMVRILAGTLSAILESRDRSRAGPTLPAKGLFLKCVDYPEKEEQP